MTYPSLWVEEFRAQYIFVGAKEEAEEFLTMSGGVSQLFSWLFRAPTQFIFLGVEPKTDEAGNSRLYATLGI